MIGCTIHLHLEQFEIDAASLRFKIQSVVQAASQGMCDVMDCEQAIAASCQGISIGVLLDFCRAHHEQHHITMTCALKCVILVVTYAVTSTSA